MAMSEMDYMSGGDGSAVKVSAGDVYSFGIMSGNTWNDNDTHYDGATYDVSGISSVTLRYFASDSYASSRGQLGYEIDGTETQITDYINSFRTQTVSLASASELKFYGRNASSAQGCVLAGSATFA